MKLVTLVTTWILIALLSTGGQAEKGKKSDSDSDDSGTVSNLAVELFTILDDLHQSLQLIAPNVTQAAASLDAAWNGLSEASNNVTVAGDALLAKLKSLIEAILSPSDLEQLINATGPQLDGALAELKAAIEALQQAGGGKEFPEAVERFATALKGVVHLVRQISFQLTSETATDFAKAVKNLEKSLIKVVYAAIKTIQETTEALVTLASTRPGGDTGTPVPDTLRQGLLSLTRAARDLISTMNDAKFAITEERGEAHLDSEVRDAIASLLYY